MTPVKKSSPSQGLYPIRTVSDLTGINPVTLRAWERRYGFIAPRRTPKGHRLYTDQDIQIIHRVQSLLRQGVAIGQVGNILSREEASPVEHQQNEAVWEDFQKRMLDAITRFEVSELEDIYNDVLALYPIDLVTSRLILPLLTELGERWDKRTTGIAEEHFFTMYFRNKLGARLHHLSMRNIGRKLMVACFPGELHEMGMLLFALHAGINGYRTVLLGPSMPFNQLAEAAQNTQANAIVLSAATVPDANQIDTELPALVSASPVPVFIGGSGIIRLSQAIEASGAIPVGDEPHAALRMITAQLG